MHEYGQRPDILSDDKKRTQIIRTLRSENIDFLKETNHEKTVPDYAVLKQIDIFRQSLLDPEDALIDATERQDPENQFFAKIYKLYQSYLVEKNIMDFERMIQQAIKILEKDAEGEKKYISKFFSVALK